MELDKILESEYARKLKMGDIAFKDIPDKFKEKVREEMIANGFTEEVEAVG